MPYLSMRETQAGEFAGGDGFGGSKVCLLASEVGLQGAFGMMQAGGGKLQGRGGPIGAGLGFSREPGGLG